MRKNDNEHCPIQNFRNFTLAKILFYEGEIFDGWLDSPAYSRLGRRREVCGFVARIP
jgi:hypothetical protein